MTDIEEARKAREAKAEEMRSHTATQIAASYVEAMSADADAFGAATQSTALMIAVIAVCDAFGITRATAVECFTDLAKNLTYPAAVIK